ncbi:MAG: alpha-ketoglutarate-dependent dioxygenase AlkB [Neomegalonema sp.]|nr:alpha-ketoglutarate-dependent dioxygenase AlkB [Neomegalonema sp.]
MLSGLEEHINGFRVISGALTVEEQSALLMELAEIVRAAPLVRPLTPWGKPMRVGMTSAGGYGWTTDRRGYRYEPAHPETGRPWPAIPERLLALWARYSDVETPPDSCLINHYPEGGRMGLHQDKDEADFNIPVVSVSLGDPAVFRMGGLQRSEPTSSITLYSGDVVVIGGDARLAFHGVDRIKFGESSLLAAAPEFGAGRINITLRRAAAIDGAASAASGA